MKKSILTFAAFWVFSFVFAQTENDFLGIPMMRDFKSGSKILVEKGFEVLSYASDSVLLQGSLEPFGECQVVLREICQKVIFRNNEEVNKALKERYGEPSVSEEGYENYYVSEYSVASIERDSAFTRIAVLDLTDMFTIKFKGVTLGAPLREVLPQLEKDFDYVMSYKGYTILKGKFAGYRDCSIYVGAENDNEIVSVVAVYLPTTSNWNSLYTQYCNLKSSLSQKYGEPKECNEDLVGRRQNKILDLIYGDISCKTIFAASVFGEVQLSLSGYEESSEGAILLQYTDLLSLKKQGDIDADDL